MGKWLIGIDEVGRGPLAGPVCVCACAIKVFDHKKMRWARLNDSKKMREEARNIWHQKALQMKKSGTLLIGIAMRSANHIDANGINKSLQECINDALKKLSIKPNQCTVFLDGGLKAPSTYKNQKTIIRGDQKKKIISLASVVAKVTRDKRMLKLHELHPSYEWGKNKGYGTRVHIKALKIFGASLLHRKTFIHTP